MTLKSWWWHHDQHSCHDRQHPVHTANPDRVLSLSGFFLCHALLSLYTLLSFIKEILQGTYFRYWEKNAISQWWTWRLHQKRNPLDIMLAYNQSYQGWSHEVRNETEKPHQQKAHRFDAQIPWGSHYGRARNNQWVRAMTLKSWWWHHGQQSCHDRQHPVHTARRVIILIDCNPFLFYHLPSCSLTAEKQRERRKRLAICLF